MKTYIVLTTIFEGEMEEETIDINPFSEEHKAISFLENFIEKKDKEYRKRYRSKAQKDRCVTLGVEDRDDCYVMYVTDNPTLDFCQAKMFVKEMN